jgi:hypothetical protein
VRHELVYAADLGEEGWLFAPFEQTRATHPQLDGDAVGGHAGGEESRRGELTLGKRRWVRFINSLIAFTGVHWR